MASPSHRQLSHEDAGDFESSPDPLAPTLNPGRAAKITRASKRSQKEPLVSTSANARRTTLDYTLGKPDFSSPSKSTSVHTASGPGLSPWRIKVTVEAEPEMYSADAADASPTRRPMIRTTTTTVPLKSAADSSPVKRRGRPRKSDAVISEKPKRIGTPIRRKSQARKSSVGIEDQPTTGEESTIEPAVQPRRRGRPRKSIAPQEVPISSEDHSRQSLNELSNAGEFAPFQPTESIEPSIEKAPISNAVSTTHIERGHDGIPHSQRSDCVEATTSNQSNRWNASAIIDIDATEGSIILPEHISSFSASANNSAAPVANEDYDKTPHASPRRHQPLVDADDFSMVSVESLESYRAVISSPVAPVPDIEAAAPPAVVIDDSSSSISVASLSMAGATLMANLELSVLDDAPSYIRSSPPSMMARYITPVMDLRSPSQPPPLEAPTISIEKASTPKLAKVVRAGIALQGVLDPEPTRSPSRSSLTASEQRKNRLDDIFSGFSENTRRELRAGLRLGEELARRARERSMSSEPPSAPAAKSKEQRVSNLAVDGIFNPKHVQASNPSMGYPRLPTPDDKLDYVLNAPLHEKPDLQVQYPTLNARINELQLISPVLSDDEMSWQANTPPTRKENSRAIKTKQSTGQQPSQLSSKAPTGGQLARNLHEEFDQHPKSDTAIQAQSEHLPKAQSHPGVLKGTLVDLWQEEAAKPKRRNPKPKPQSTPVLNDTLADLWEEEASRSSNSGEQALKEISKSQETEQPENVADLFPDDSHVFKPRRAKLPRTWRRKSGNDFNYSDEVEAEEVPRVETTQSSPTTQVKSTAQKQTSIHTLEIQQEDVGSSSSEEREPQLTPGPSEDGRIAPSNHGSSIQSQLRAEARDDLASSSLDGVQAVVSKQHYLYNQFGHGDVERNNLRSTVIPSLTEERQTHQLRTEIKTRAEVTIQQQILPTRIPEPDSQAIDAEPSSSASSAATSGLFTRITSSFWPFKQAETTSDQSTKAAADITTQVTPQFSLLPAHPIIAKHKLNPLPKIEPWTKTHYKTMDFLYQRSLADPSPFDPTEPLNAQLLASFPNRRRLLGAIYSSWGYTIEVTEADLVLAAVFLQLLTLSSADEYARLAGKPIDIGKGHNPGPAGEPIEEHTVVRRIFTVIAGEMIREDEKLGREIQRHVPMEITYRWHKE